MTMYGIAKNFCPFLVIYNYSQIARNNKQRDILTVGTRLVAKIESLLKT